MLGIAGREDTAHRQQLRLLQGLEPLSCAQAKAGCHSQQHSAPLQRLA